MFKQMMHSVTVENIEEGFPAPVAVGTGVVPFLALVGANLMGGTIGLG